MQRDLKVPSIAKRSFLASALVNTHSLSLLDLSLHAIGPNAASTPRYWREIRSGSTLAWNKCIPGCRTCMHEVEDPVQDCIQVHLEEVSAEGHQRQAVDGVGVEHGSKQRRLSPPAPVAAAALQRSCRLTMASFGVYPVPLSSSTSSFNLLRTTQWGGASRRRWTTASSGAMTGRQGTLTAMAAPRRTAPCTWRPPPTLIEVPSLP
jgi:hypothetical protein